MSPFDKFDLLQLPDGRPDLCERRIKLKELVKHLTVSEILTLRALLDGLVNKNGNSFFEGLPNELCISIGEYLSLNDLIRMRLTCRSWHRIYSDPHLCLYMINKHLKVAWMKKIEFPGTNPTLEGSYAVSKSDKKWLQMRSIKLARRERGIPLHYLKKSSTPYRKLQYSNYRLAYFEDWTIAVSSLRSNKNLHYKNPTREYIHKWLLSDELLIASFAVPAKLFIWELSKSNPKHYHEFQIPAPVFSLSARCRQVGIVTSSFEVLIWRVGGFLKLLHTIETTQDDENEVVHAANVFFHAEKEDICILVYHSTTKYIPGTKHATKITVQKFESSKLIQTQHTTVYTSRAPGEHSSRLISDQGKIAITVREYIDLGEADDLYRLLTYDMAESKFQVLEIHIHPSIARNLYNSSNLIWHDQIYYPIYDSRNNQTNLRVIKISDFLTDIWRLGANKEGLDDFFANSSILAGEKRLNGDYINYRNQYNPTGAIVCGDDKCLVTHDRSTTLQIWFFESHGNVKARLQHTIE